MMHDGVYVTYSKVIVVVIITLQDMQYIAWNIRIVWNTTRKYIIALGVYTKYEQL